MKNKAKLNIILAMLIFGTIGIFREQIPMPSSFIAIMRSLLGSIFLLIIGGKNINFSNIKSNIKYLLLSGSAIGVNWVLLFEAYNYTSIPAATLYYYMAPIFVILCSPIFLKESLALKDILCGLVAALGIFFVSGIIGGSSNNFSLKGMLFGLGAAVLYSSVVIMNKKIVGISAIDKTIVQLTASTLVLIPYFLINRDFSALTFSYKSVVLIIIMGIVHTGIAYSLFLGSIDKVSAKTTAILSYLDPVFAIILSSVFYMSMPSVYTVLGAVMILGSSLFMELSRK